MPRKPGAKQREYHRDLMRQLRAQAELWALFPRKLAVNAKGMPIHSESVAATSLDWALDQGVA